MAVEAEITRKRLSDEVRQETETARIKWRETLRHEQDALRAELMSRVKWPTKMLPQVAGDGIPVIFAPIREYLFVSLFKACAESLTSENASRLGAMQRAQRNIDDLLELLQAAFHQKRQTSIDAELFDVISGFEVLADHHRAAKPQPEVNPSALTF